MRFPGKTVSHFSGNCLFVWTQFRTENRFTLFLELLPAWLARYIGPGIILVGFSSIGNSALLHFTFGFVGLNRPFGLSTNQA